VSALGVQPPKALLAYRMEVQAATTIAEWDIHGIYIYIHIYI
jgi:hypothetical protein